MRYWKKNYGYVLSFEDYEEFNKNVKIIKKIYKLHDFVISFDKSNIGKANKDIIDIYVKNYKNINDALPIVPYLKTLTREKTQREIDEENSIPFVLTFE